MASKKTAKSKRKPVSSETRAKHAELARKQWADPARWLRKRKLEGSAKLRREPPPYAAELIKAACSEFGANITQLCYLLQCHPNTLSAWRHRYPEIEEAVVTSRRIEEDKLWGMLYKHAIVEEHLTACIVALKMKFHARDAGPIPGQGEDTPVQTALKIREALREMMRVDGELGGTENVPFGGNYKAPHN